MYPQVFPMIVTQGYIGEEGVRRPGDKIRVIEQRARYLIQHGLAKQDKPAPAVAGPAENAMAEGPTEKKSSAAPTIGPLTGSSSSSAAGLVTPVRVSPAAPASPAIRSNRSGRGARAARAGV